MFHLSRTSEPVQNLGRYTPEITRKNKSDCIRVYIPPIQWLKIYNVR